MDGKGRLSIPARYRDVLMAMAGGQLVVCKSPAGCLKLFPLPVWEQFEAGLVTLALEQEGWRRLYVGSATDVEMDGAARVLIPPELRKWAGLERDVKLMGMGSYFELWDTARYAEREAKLLESPAPDAVLGMVIG